MNNKSKINRNAPCWCGSQKKYKQCHFEFDETLKSLSLQGYPIPNRSLIKTKEDLAGIKKSCQLTKQILDDLNTIIKPGITTNEIDQWVYETTIKHNAIPAPLNYKGFPKSICTSINEVVCHGIPEDRVLIEGDILNVDVTCIINGYYGDSCRMYPIGKISEKASHLINITKECLEESIKNLKPFDPINKIGDTISEIAARESYSVVKIFGGHGTGKKFHEDPFVFHYKKREKLMICAPGMVFTIEPMINEGNADCIILEDNWTAVTKDNSLSAQWEHTVYVNEDSIEILT
ncbi:MAG: type I methionyl aminopeptidase [Rickettsiales bacterium]|nr:type I methionyl aminopeptidase [Rickettsiales bacterium]|tara:strand:- start:27542 stop:28414 length:873 start_codon:yes stop_codon:yes gene_type:complete